MSRLYALILHFVLYPLERRLRALEENVTTLEQDWHRHDEPHMHITYKVAESSDTERVNPIHKIWKQEIEGTFKPQPTCGDCRDFKICMGEDGDEDVDACNDAFVSAALDPIKKELPHDA